jgi:hypothetical protein
LALPTRANNAVKQRGAVEITQNVNAEDYRLNDRKKPILKPIKAVVARTQRRSEEYWFLLQILSMVVQHWAFISFQENPVFLACDSKPTLSNSFVRGSSTRCLARNARDWECSPCGALGYWLWFIRRFLSEGEYCCYRHSRSNEANRQRHHDKPRRDIPVVCGAITVEPNDSGRNQ